MWAWIPEGWLCDSAWEDMGRRPVRLHDLALSPIACGQCSWDADEGVDSSPLALDHLAQVLTRISSSQGMEGACAEFRVWALVSLVANLLEAAILACNQGRWPTIQGPALELACS